MRNNIIKAIFHGNTTVCKTAPVYQGDYGLVMQITHPDLPSVYEVHFANAPQGTATTQIGGADGVSVPDVYLTTGQNLYAWVFLHTGESDGETTLTITTPVIRKGAVSDQPAPPEQQSVITEAIAVLNHAVETTGQDVIDAGIAKTAAEAAQGKAEDAQAAAEVAQRLAESAKTGAEAAQEAAETARDRAEAATVHEPQIGDDGYWYVWDQNEEDYVKTDTKAQGEGSSDYSALSNKPKINNVELSGNKSLDDLGAASASDVAAKYTKPQTGIPKTDLASDVQTSLGKADTALQTAPVTSVNGQTGAVTIAVPAIDDTLTQTGEAADAKAVGDEIEELKSGLNASPHIVQTDASGVDLDVIDDDGNVIMRLKDGHIQTKEFDSDDINAAKVTTAISDLDLVDDDGNVIVRFKNGHLQTKNFDSERESGIIGKNADITDGVYAACRWHQPNASSKQFCMLIAGDTHTDPTRMNRLIEYLNAVDAFDAGIMLGDISGNTFADSISYYSSALMSTQRPFLTVLGNHDVGGATSDAELYQKYGGLFQYANLASGEPVSGKCYYYKDFSSYKIRIIVLMQYDYTYNGNLCFGKNQIDWLITTLNSTPSDYGVIIAEHTNPSRYMTYNLNAEYTSSTWYQSNYAPTVMSGDPVPDIVNAWINGTTLSQTYSYTYENPPSDLTVSADFTTRGAGEFITYVGGHWHMDVLGTPTSYTNQHDYHVPAAGLNAATQGDIPRRAGTVSEDSFCALAVDRDKKTVKIFHVGAHRTKDAVDRQYFKYGYGE